MIVARPAHEQICSPLIKFITCGISKKQNSPHKARSFFDWDDKTVDGFFCENSRYAFFNGLDKNGDINLQKPILPPIISKEEANSVLKVQFIDFLKIL